MCFRPDYPPENLAGLAALIRQDLPQSLLLDVSNLLRRSLSSAVNELLKRTGGFLVPRLLDLLRRSSWTADFTQLVPD